MEKSTELKNKKTDYQECLRRVRNTATALEKSINTVNSAISTQSEAYNVDDVKGGTNYLNYLLEKENGIYSDIVNNVIPALTSKISGLTTEITDQTQKEALAKGGKNV